MSHGPQTAGPMTEDEAQEVLSSHDMLPLVKAIAQVDALAVSAGESKDEEELFTSSTVREFLPPHLGPPQCLDAVFRAIASQIDHDADKEEVHNIPTYRVRLKYPRLDKQGADDNNITMRVPRDKLEDLFNIAMFNGADEFVVIREPKYDGKPGPPEVWGIERERLLDPDSPLVQNV